MKLLRRIAWVAALGFWPCAFAVLLLASLPAWGETWLTASIASYHFKRGDYCEANIGVGFEHGKGAWRVVAGTYQNSLCNPSNYIGLNWAPLQFGNWRLGTALLAITGYEEQKKKLGDKVVIAPLPTLAWEGKTYGANFVVIPPYDDFRGAVGLQFKVRW